MTILSLVPNYYGEPITVTEVKVVTLQKKISLAFFLFSTAFVFYFTVASITNWIDVEYQLQTASIPLTAIYNAESAGEKRAKYGQTIVGYVTDLWKSKVPVVSGKGNNPETGVWGSSILESMPEIPLSIYLFKEDEKDVSAFIQQSFSGPSRCAEMLLKESELHNDFIPIRSLVDIGTSTIDGSSRYKVGAQDGSNDIVFRDFPFPSLVTDDYEVFTSYGNKQVTRVSSKLCGRTRSTDRPLYADYVSLVIHNENDWFQAGDTYQVDVAIDAPIAWGNGQENWNRNQPSLEFILKPGVTIIASLRLDVMVDKEGNPFDGGYKLTIVGERERGQPPFPNGFEDMKPDGNTAGRLGLTLELAEVNYMIMTRTDIFMYTFIYLSELGGGLGLIATLCGVILVWMERIQKKKKEGKGKRFEEVEVENDINVQIKNEQL